MNIYRFPLRNPKEKEETRIALEHLQGSSAFGAFTQYLEDLIADEREAYENISPASEYHRGRLNVLTDLRKYLS